MPKVPLAVRGALNRNAIAGWRTSAWTQTAAANLMLAGLGAGSGFVLARVLGPEGRGQLAAIQVIGLAIASISMLGMNETLVYFVRRTPGAALQLARSCLTIAMLSTLASAVVGATVIVRYLSSLDANELRLAQLWTLVAVVSAFTGIGVVTHRAVGDERRWNLIRVFPGVSWLAAALLSLRFGTTQERLNFIIPAQLIALTLIGMWAWHLASTRHGIRPGASLGRGGELVRYGAPLALGALPQVLNIRFDQLILAAAVPSNELGYYVVGFAWATLVAPLVSTFSIRVFPLVSAASSPLEQRQIVRKLAVPTVSVAFGASLGCVVFAPIGVPLLFGAQFEGAVPSAQLLGAAAGVLGLSQFLGGVLQGIGETKAVFSTELAGLLANGVLLAALVPRSGIAGAAGATLAAYLVTLLLRLGVVRRETAGERR